MEISTEEIAFGVFTIFMLVVTLKLTAHDSKNNDANLKLK